MVMSSSWLEMACSAAMRARSSPLAWPTAISAAPPSDMIVRTSAKSRLIKPGTVISSEMPWIPWRSTSSATRKACCRLARLSTICSSRSLGMTISVSACSLSLAMPDSADWMRREPSKVKGRVTTPMVSAPTSLAIWATMASPAGAGAAAHAGGDEDHIGAFEHFVQLLGRFLGRLAAHLRVAARTQAAGQLFADAHAGGGPGQVQRLGIGVDCHEIDALQALVDHAIDGIAATASNAHDFDAGKGFELIGLGT